MAILGFSYSKIDSQRISNATAKGLEVRHNLSIDSMEKTTINVGGKNEDILKVNFTFEVLYGSGSFGKVSLGGDLLYADTKEILDETFKAWETTKELPSSVKLEIHRFAYNKSIVKSLEISDLLSLPAPIPLPKLEVKGTEKKK